MNKLYDNWELSKEFAKYDASISYTKAEKTTSHLDGRFLNYYSQILLVRRNVLLRQDICLTGIDNFCVLNH